MTYCVWEAKPHNPHCPQHAPESHRRDRARLPQHTFSLARETETFALEFLLALQERDREGVDFNPQYARILIAAHSGLPTFRDADVTGSLRNVQALHLDLLHRVRRHHSLWSGEDLWEQDIWDGATLQIPSSKKGQIARKSVLDFRGIRIPWVRQMVKSWAKDNAIDNRRINAAIQAFEVVSEVLTSTGKTQPSDASHAEATAVIKRFSSDHRPDGLPYSGDRHVYLVTAFQSVLEYARATNSPRDLASGFALTKFNRPARVITESEERAGKALPAHVIDTFDQNLHLFRPKGTGSRVRAGWSVDLHADLLQTMYKLYRDTGRRPNEIAALSLDCVQVEDDGAFTLLYDNTKAGRLGRTLPIDESTAQAIFAWRRSIIAMMGEDCRWLFPSPGRHAKQRMSHINPSSFADTLKLWAASIPSLVFNEVTSVPFPSERINVYAFRHSYAQRHADSGTPVDTLRVLMDHKSIDTTMGYYKVTLKRKRQAQELVSKFTADVTGPVPGSGGGAAYERRTVAVPFGSCKEPSNVKAGGQSCVLRFRCSGCKWFNSDPSFLPELATHIGMLRKQIEAAHTFGHSLAVITGMEAELDLYIQIRDAVREQIDDLPEDARLELDEATKVLKKVRSSQTFLPLPSIQKPDNYEERFK